MLEFPAIIKLGGRNEAHRKLTDVGFVNTVNAMSMWRVRGSIPGDATRLLMQVGEAEGLQFRSDDFELQEQPELGAA